MTQEKKHQEAKTAKGASAGRPGRKGAEKKTDRPAEAAVPDETPAAVPAESSATAPPQPSAALDASMAVMAKLKEMEFYSRATLERLAEMVLTVEDELKQTTIVAPLGEVYAAQNVLQAKLTVLIDAYKHECDRMQGGQA